MSSIAPVRRAIIQKGAVGSETFTAEPQRTPSERMREFFKERWPPFVPAASLWFHFPRAR